MKSRQSVRVLFYRHRRCSLFSTLLSHLNHLHANITFNKTLELYNIIMCCFASPKLKLQIQIKSDQKILFKDVPMFKILVCNRSKCCSISLGNHYRWLAFQTENVLFLEWILFCFVHRLQFVLQFYLKLFN